MVVVACTFSGCRILGNDDGGSYTSGNGTITGNITLGQGTGSIRAGGSGGLQGVRVYLEERTDLFGLTDENGNYQILNVPPGIFHVIAKLMAEGKTHKMRSGATTVDANGNQSVDLALREATIKVTGKLKIPGTDSIPAGTKLWLWGESFDVGADGSFETPELPDLSFLDGLAFLQDIIFNPGQTTEFRIPVAFVAGQPISIEFTVSSSGSTAELPKAALMAFDAATNGKLATETEHDTTLYLTATVSPEEPTSVDWTNDGGEFGTETVNGGTRTRTWKAPAVAGTYNITITVTNDGKTAKAVLPIVVKGAQNYTVTFNSNGGTAVQAQTVAHGGKVTQPTAPTKAGGIFGGWYSDVGLTTAWNFDTNTVTSNMTLYAKWTQSQYTVTFEKNGGVGDIPNQTVAHGGKVTQPAAPTKVGSTFGGWYSNVGLTTAWDFDSNTVTSNMTLYAKWTQSQYTVTFNSNGGSAVQAQTVAHGGKVTQPAAPTKSGYFFSGWYSDAELTTVWNFDTSTVTQNTTLCAKWVSVLSATKGANGTFDITIDINVRNVDGTPRTGLDANQVSLSYSAVNPAVEGTNVLFSATAAGTFHNFVELGGGAYRVTYTGSQGNHQTTFTGLRVYTVPGEFDTFTSYDGTVTETTPSNLLLRYNFNSQNSDDSSGAGNHGVNVGGVTYELVSGSDYALKLDGSSGHVVMPDNLITALTTYTVFMRFKAAAGKRGVLIGYSSEAVEADWAGAYVPMIYIDTDGKLRAGDWQESGRTQIVSAGTVDDGNWHSVAITFTDNEKLRVYLDGAKIGEAAWSDPDLVVDPLNPTKTLSGYDALSAMEKNQIGVNKADAWALTSGIYFYYEGLLDDVTILNGALSDAEILNLHNNSYSVHGRVLRYSFDGQNCADLSGYGRDGMPTDMTFPNVSGSNYAASFNGATSYVAIPNNVVSPLTNYTVRMKFKTNGGKGVLLGYQLKAVGEDNWAAAYVPMLYIGSDGKLYAGDYHNLNGKTQVVSAAAVNDNQWYDVAIAFTNNDKFRVYLNGNFIGDQPWQELNPVTVPMPYNQLGVGYSTLWANAGDEWQYYTGWIDDMEIYDYPLSADEINALANP